MVPTSAKHGLEKRFVDDPIAKPVDMFEVKTYESKLAEYGIPPEDHCYAKGISQVHLKHSETDTF